MIAYSYTIYRFYTPSSGVYDVSLGYSKKREDFIHNLAELTIHVHNIPGGLPRLALVSLSDNSGCRSGFAGQEFLLNLQQVILFLPKLGTFHAESVIATLHSETEQEHHS